MKYIADGQTCDNPTYSYQTLVLCLFRIFHLVKETEFTRAKVGIYENHVTQNIGVNNPSSD
jgi:hypothetical protein